MKRFLSWMLCAAMLLGLLPGGIVLRAAAAESGYVTDNLVLYLDANNNTGSGYDAAADTWKNLAAGGEEIALNGSVWGTDATYGTHYLSVGSYIILPDSVRQALAGGAFTVEFVMDDYEGTTKDGDNIRNIMALTGSDRWIAASVDMVGTPNDKFVIYQNKGELTVNFKVNDGVDAWNTRTNVPASSINGATQTIAFQTGENAKWYQGGALKNTSGVTYPDAPGVSTFSGAQSGEVPQVIFGAAEDRVAERAFSGKVRAIRVYKDVLTDSEIAANARYDVKRHYTKAEESVVPAGYVTDDLVLYLDANNNTGSGYDSTSTVWANLVAPDQTVAINGQVWGSDREHGSHYLAFDDNYILLPDEVRRALAGERFTIEFVMDDFTIENNGSICNVMCVTGDDAYIKEFKDGDRTKTEATPNDSFVIFAARNGSDDVKFRTCYGTTGWASITEEGKYANVKASKMSGVTNALLFDNAEGQKWYLDGDLEATKEIAVEGKTINLNGFKVGSTWTSDRTCQIAFGAATDVIANRYFNGNVKAIRIYRDTLTAAEIAQNAAADQVRYYTDYVPAAVIPEGYETDGLVLFLDANSNTGKTFDSAAANWVDLSDESGSTVVDLNGHTWGSNEDYANSNYLSINNGYIKLPEKVRQAIAGGEFTIEFLIDDYAGNPTNATSSIANIMALTGSDRWIEAKTTPGGTPNDNFVVFQHIGDNKVQLKINSYYNRATVSAATIDGTTQALTFKADGKPSWHQNGTVRSTAGEDYVAPNVASFSGAQAGEVPQVIFGAATDTVADRTFVAKVQAIRVYDRVLSADELKGNADADKARYRSGSFKEAAAEAWANVIGTLGELGQTVTLAQLKTYAEDKLDSAGLVDVSVTDAGNGAYEFTYCKKGTDEKIITHTLYVDVPYQVDTDRLTAEQKEAFLADVVGYGGNEKNQVTINWDNADNALYYKGTRAGDPVSHLYFPVYTTANNYVYEAEVGFDSYGSWSCMAFGASEVLEHYQYAFYGSFGKESTGGAAEFVRFQDPAENGGTFATGHDNISGIKLGELMGDGTNGTIDASLYDTGHATQYQVKDT
ncbi:MAG: hypothetical protein IKV68_06790, partial [Oscillospiraceae bacterium]|nr:hypothetical protein [Oscillospiraceae bacterium]